MNDATSQVGLNRKKDVAIIAEEASSADRGRPAA